LVHWPEAMFAPRMRARPGGSLRKNQCSAFAMAIITALPEFSALPVDGCRKSNSTPRFQFRILYPCLHGSKKLTPAGLPLAAGNTELHENQVTFVP